MKVFKIEFQESIPDDYLGKTYYPSIVETMNSLSRTEVDLIYTYMMSCTVLAEWVSPSRDPMNKDIWIENTSYSDGIYYWSKLHAHVIKTYKISVPEEFKLHVKKQIASGKDFSNLDAAYLREQEEKVFEELEKTQGEDYNVWTEGEPGALILDISEILARRKFKLEK